MARTLVLISFGLLLIAPATQSAQQLKLLHSLNGHESLMSTLEAIFNDKNPDALVEIAYTDVHENEIQAKTSPLYPTAILMPADKIGKIQSFLSPIPRHWLPDSVDRSYLDSVTIDSMLYGIPIFSGNHLLLYFNKKHIAKPATSWEELVQQTAPLRPFGVAPVGFPIHSPFYLLSFLKAFDGGFFNQDGVPDVNSDANLSALNFYQQQQSNQVFASNCGWDCGKSLFHEGKTAYSIDIDNAATINAKQLADNFGVAPLPSINGQPIAGYYTTVGLFLPHQLLDNDEQLLLKRLIDYLSSMEVQTRFALNGYLMPVHKGTKRIIENLNDPSLSAIYTQLQRSHRSPNSAAMHQIWISLGRDLPLYLNHQLSGEEMLENAQNAAEAKRNY